MTPLNLVKHGYDLFLKGDAGGVIGLYSDDCTFTPQMGLEGKTPLVTPRGTFRRNEMAGFFTALAGELDFTTWENRQFGADGNTVIVLGYYGGKNKRTGKSFGCEFAHVLTVAGDKVKSFKEFTDTAHMLAIST